MIVNIYLINYLSVILMCLYDLLGGHLAAAWVALRSFGQEGYINMASKLMDVTEKMKNTINNTPVCYLVYKS